jgi:hypothetical protein
MRTSFHHQPEAQHPNFQLSTSWQADYPIFGALCGLRSDISRGPSCANSRHMQRSKLRFYSITSSAHFPVSNTSASLGLQMTKWLSLGSRCAARHPTSVVTCFFFARLLWIIGAQ